ncbi:fimbrial protein [Pseudomonas glycinae]|uniref:fimbrial protein n=1 Tax=Candidatus Pseudomonas auctus TaxID=3461260 RepID=UPI003B8F6665
MYKKKALRQNQENYSKNANPILKRPINPMKKEAALLLLIGMLSSAELLADCYISKKTPPTESGARTINFSAPATVDVAADSIDVNVVNIAKVGVGENIITSCDQRTATGFVVDPSRGATPASDTYPLNIPGLEFRVVIDGWTALYPLSAAKPHLIIPQKGVVSVVWYDGPYRLYIKKTGEIEPGTVIPAGPLGRWQSADGFVLVNFNLMNPIKVVTSSCSVDSVNVKMGDDYQLHELSKFGDTTKAVPFNLLVRGCGKAVNSVRVTFDTLPGQDPKEGFIPLDPQSTAGGLGIKLMNGTGTLLQMKNQYTIENYVPGQDSADFPLLASYVRISGETLKAGTANASVRFTMTYM